MLSETARVALTLKLLGGLSTEQIAHATLEREATVAQRIVRAKRALAAAPRSASSFRGRRSCGRESDSVLGVIYLIFNEGYVAPRAAARGPSRHCAARRSVSGRVLAELVPRCRRGSWARRADGAPGLALACTGRSGRRGVLLADQERSALGPAPHPTRAERRSSARRARSRASVRTACRRRLPRATRRPVRAKRTDWVRIAALYDALGEIAPSPVVELNRAVAVSMAYGPDAGLAVLEAVAGHPAMSNYYLFLSVRGDLLERLGRFTDAESAFRAAAAMTANEQEQLLLSRRADQAGARAIVGSDPALIGELPEQPGPMAPKHMARQ